MVVDYDFVTVYSHLLLVDETRLIQLNQFKYFYLSYSFKI